MSAGTYDNVYFMFVDAAGHSSIVANNPRDRATDAFDLLRERIEARLRHVATDHRCGWAVVWQWAGDGGLIVIHDERESVAAATALDVACSLLKLDLRHLRDEVGRIGVRGELRLRVAIHKGAMRYRGPGHESGIYGPAINLAAHLERATPPDTIAISADVQRVAGTLAHGFEPVGAFEGTEIYVLAAGGGSAVRPWLAAHGLAGGVRVHAYHERPSQYEKARLVDAASHEIIEIGAALHTCANYLVTTERPARFRQAMLDFLGRGGTYRCVLTDPEGDAAKAVRFQRGEDLPGKARDSVAKFRQFKREEYPGGERLEVYATLTHPATAAFAVDIDGPQALIMYSPYLVPIGPDAWHIERADMPHYLIDRSAGDLFASLSETVKFTSAEARRLL